MTHKRKTPPDIEIPKMKKKDKSLLGRTREGSPKGDKETGKLRIGLCLKKMALRVAFHTYTRPQELQATPGSHNRIFQLSFFSFMKLH